MHFIFVGAAFITLHLACVLVHELAHLCAAWMIGWRPLTLSLGFGARQTVFQIGDLKVQVGSIPIGGFVGAVALNPAYFRLKSFIFAAAGPLASIAVIVLIYKTLLQPGPPAPNEPWAKASAYIVLIESIILASNLWLRYINGGDRWIPSDGLQMWEAVTMQREDIPRQFSSNLIAYGARLFETGRTSEAQMLVEQVMSDFRPPNVLDQKQLYIQLLMAVGDEGAANAICDELTSPQAPYGAARGEMLDSLACLPLFHRLIKLLPRALAWIDEAIELEPDCITFKGTKGSLLVESGEFAAGLELLEEVRRTSTSENDQAICSYYVALAHHGMGEWEKAEAELRHAQSAYPECIVAHWIIRTIRDT